jgi:hypothetical protein
VRQDAELPERKRAPGQLPRSTFVPHGVRLNDNPGSAPPSPSPSTRSNREELGGRDFVLVRCTCSFDSVRAERERRDVTAMQKRIVTGGISGGRSLTRPFRDARPIPLIRL